MAGIRVEAAGWRSRAGVAHLLLAAVVVVIAGLAIAALYDSTRSSSPDRRPSQRCRRLVARRETSTLRRIARTVGPAVVDLEVSLGSGDHASATGMVITPSGEVVTNNHSNAGATAMTARIAGRWRNM